MPAKKTKKTRTKKSAKSQSKKGKPSKPKVMFQTPTGMPDILPQDQPYFEKVLRIAENFSFFYGFQKLDTPILEFAELFEKGTGADTDIVEKEMYSLRTKGGDVLALRPEFTPPLARAYIEHGMASWPQPVKLFSSGPIFRHERPQAGRLRQFHQFNLEVFGSKEPIVDVEIIFLCYKILQALGLKDILIELNSLGCRNCRSNLKKLLINYLKRRQNFLCPTCKERLKRNPLRVFDCKQEACQQVVANAPQLLDHLCNECHRHLKNILEFLDELEIPYLLNPYLVRGLDYYTKTVFEMIPEGTRQGSQTSLIGGGRYDDLIKQFSKKDVPAVGAAAGVERIINLIKEREIKVPLPSQPKVFLAQLGNSAKIKALKLLEEFRKKNFLVAHSFERDSLTKQLELANKLNVKYTLILGEEEVKKETIILRDMESGKQSSLKIDKIVQEVKKRLK